jgi:hypothetical protein
MADPWARKLWNMLDHLGHPCEPRVKLKDPETFSGKHAEKITVFTNSCALVFLSDPRSFRDKASKVIYAISRLVSPASDYFLHNIAEMETTGVAPVWFDSWWEFKIELNLNFGNRNPDSFFANKLEALKMKETDAILPFLLEFNHLSSNLEWTEEPLSHRFYEGLAERIKDQVLLIGRPCTLDLLKQLASDIDSRYQERAKEMSRGCGTHAAPARAVPVTPARPAVRPPAPVAPFVPNAAPARPPLDPALFNANGHLLPSVKQMRLDKGLCVYCGAAGHVATLCPKRAFTAGRRGRLQAARAANGAAHGGG